MILRNSRSLLGVRATTENGHPRTAMAAMRHSRMELTMTYYTDPVLLDVAGAVEALPDFSGKAAGRTGRDLKTAVGAVGRA